MKSKKHKANLYNYTKLVDILLEKHKSWLEVKHLHSVLSLAVVSFIYLQNLLLLEFKEMAIYIQADESNEKKRIYMVIKHIHVWIISNKTRRRYRANAVLLSYGGSRASTPNVPNALGGRRVKSVQHHEP